MSKLMVFYEIKVTGTKTLTKNRNGNSASIISGQLVRNATGLPIAMNRIFPGGDSESVNFHRRG